MMIGSVGKKKKLNASVNGNSVVERTGSADYGKSAKEKNERTAPRIGIALVRRRTEVAVLRS
jgi:hypothetical protein